jgi:hypothetical protein
MKTSISPPSWAPLHARSCGSCGTELLGLFRCADLKKIKFQIPDLKCAKCGGVASFDDIPEEYFAFLQRE